MTQLPRSTHRRRVLPNGRTVRPERGRPVRHGLMPPGIKTEAGVLVRSQPEKTCADFLTANGVEFRYEPLMLVGGRQVRPDFYLPDHDLFIEICGYNHMPHYRQRIAEKKKMYSAAQIPSVFIDYHNISQLRQQLAAALDLQGGIKSSGHRKGNGWCGHPPQ